MINKSVQKEIIILENIKYKILALAINFFLVFGLLCLPESDMLPNLPEWYNQIDLILTVILGIPLIWQLYLLFKKTGLTLNTQGIEENMSQMKTQKFLWPEIVSVKFMKMYFLKYILIYVQDPTSYMKKQSFHKKLAMTANIKKFGTPIKIPIHSIDKTPQEIANIISEYTQNLFKPNNPEQT